MNGNNRIESLISVMCCVRSAHRRVVLSHVNVHLHWPIEMQTCANTSNPLHNTTKTHTEDIYICVFAAGNFVGCTRHYSITAEVCKQSHEEGEKTTNTHISKEMRNVSILYRHLCSARTFHTEDCEAATTKKISKSFNLSRNEM